jgi:hypothetical protein
MKKVTIRETVRVTIEEDNGQTWEFEVGDFGVASQAALLIATGQASTWQEAYATASAIIARLGRKQETDEQH